MDSRSSSSSHRDLLNGAKQQQTEHLQASASASTQLIRAVEAIVKANSATSQLACSPLIDKISTIHELDREIDRQLNSDIVHSYESLVESKRKLARHVKRTQRSLAITSDSSDSYVDLVQRRVELMDQELRILEATSALVKSQE